MNRLSVLFVSLLVLFARLPAEAEQVNVNTITELLRSYADLTFRGSVSCSREGLAGAISTVEHMDSTGNFLLEVATAANDATSIATCALGSQADHRTFALFANGAGRLLALDYIASIHGRTSSSADISAAGNAQRLLTWTAFVYPDAYQNISASYKASIAKASAFAARYNSTHHSDK